MKPATHRTEMTYPADTDICVILAYLFGINPVWASEWYRKLKEAVAALEYLAERFGLAPEAEVFSRPIRQLFSGNDTTVIAFFCSR